MRAFALAAALVAVLLLLGPAPSAAREGRCTRRQRSSRWRALAAVMSAQDMYCPYSFAGGWRNVTCVYRMPGRHRCR